MYVMKYRAEIAFCDEYLNKHCKYNTFLVCNMVKNNCTIQNLQQY